MAVYIKKDGQLEKVGHTAILDINEEVVDEYFYYSKSYYTITNNAAIFPNAWQDSQDFGAVLYDIPLRLEMEIPEEDLDLYVGTDGTLEQLYNDCVNGVLSPNDNYLVGNTLLQYMNAGGPDDPFFIF